MLLPFAVIVPRRPRWHQLRLMDGNTAGNGMIEVVVVVLVIDKTVTAVAVVLVEAAVVIVEVALVAVA